MDGHPGDPGFVPSLSGIDLDDLLGELRERASAVREAHQRLSGLLGAVVAVSSELDLATVLQRIVKTACSLTVDAQYGALGVLDAEHDTSCSSSPMGWMTRPVPASAATSRTVLASSACSSTTPAAAPARHR